MVREKRRSGSKRRKKTTTDERKTLYTTCVKGIGNRLIYRMLNEADGHDEKVGIRWTADMKVTCGFGKPVCVGLKLNN